MIKSWCDACETKDGLPGHFMCKRPEVPEGFGLTGVKELTSNGWREEIAPKKIETTGE